MLLISNDPLAPRQRLADPAKPLPPGTVWLADDGNRVVGRARSAAVAGGWIALDGIERVEPFFLQDEQETVFAWNPDGPTREAAARPDQDRFRARLLREYGGRCAVTGCDVPELLDAAHLRPWRVGSEGVLLRTDLHRMIDRGLAEIRDGRFRLLPPVSAYVRSAYDPHDGAKLAEPRPPSSRRRRGKGKP